LHSVIVVAAAAGTVLATRDGTPDQLIRSQADRAEIANRECGNGVVIDHGENWQTQYCHIRRGSIGVKQGDRVEPGQKLGEIGYSGDAAFPHVHLTVRIVS
jgi:murein DD-endopeptidase MepM/ murein hydrolase activator NlpD